MTFASAYIDWSFSKEGSSTIVGYIVDSLGLEDAARAFGMRVEQLLALAGQTNGAGMNVLEQAALGKGAITALIVGGVLTYVFRRKMTSTGEFFQESVEVDSLGRKRPSRPLLDFKKSPVHASSTLVAMSFLAFLGADIQVHPAHRQRRVLGGKAKYRPIRKPERRTLDPRRAENVGVAEEPVQADQPTEG